MKRFKRKEKETKTMKLTEIIVDRKTVGKTLLLVDVVPVYHYENGQKTETIEGYRYMLVLPEKNFQKIGVKIIGEKQMEKPNDGYVDVTLEGFELFIYWLNGTYHLGARATSIKPKTS